MKVLAIDPGPQKSAWVILDGVNVVDFNIEDNDSISFRKTDHLAIEMIASYGMAVGAEVFETCVWIGRFIEMLHDRGHTKIYRKDVCLNLCGSVRAKDSNVRQALIDRYGGQSTAIGGVKCRKCKGKGWFGAGRPVCADCNGRTWENPPGPLHGITADVWQALGVGVTFQDSFGPTGESK